MKTAKDKAKELTDNFKDFVNPYIGSGMLSNTYDDDTILWQSKRCALVAVDLLIEEQTMWQNGECDPVLYWQEVRKEIEKL